MKNEYEYNLYGDDIYKPDIDINNLFNIIDAHSYTCATDDILEIELKKIDYWNKNTLDEFKIILIDLANYLERISNNKLLTDYKYEILTIINTHTQKILDTFILNCYMDKKEHDKFRRNIILGNDDFFMNNKYDKSNVTIDNISIIDEIFSFKKFWDKLHNENKNLIKSYFLTICHYADKRFILFNIYNKMKIMNKKYIHIFEKYTI